jgi:hypothetical protein
MAENESENSNMMFRAGHRILKDIVHASMWAVLAAYLLASIGFPILENALYRLVVSPTWLIWGILGLHISLAIYGVYGFYRMKDFVRALSLDDIEQRCQRMRTKIEELCQEKAESDSIVEMYVQQLEAVLGGISVLQGLLELKAPISEDNVEALLEPMILARADTLGYTDPYDLYNFAVYKYNETTNELNQYYRQCDQRIMRRDRSWRPGLGHVGIAFAQKKLIVSANVESMELLELDNERDREYYKAFISAPIMSEKETSGENPWGVLVITGNREGQLGKAVARKSLGISIAKKPPNVWGH